MFILAFFVLVWAYKRWNVDYIELHTESDERYVADALDQVKQASCFTECCKALHRTSYKPEAGLWLVTGDVTSLVPTPYGTPMSFVARRRLSGNPVSCHHRGDGSADIFAR